MWFNLVTKTCVTWLHRRFYSWSVTVNITGLIKYVSLRIVLILPQLIVSASVYDSSNRTTEGLG